VLRREKSRKERRGGKGDGDQSAMESEKKARRSERRRGAAERDGTAARNGRRERRRRIEEYLPRATTLNNSRARFPTRRANTKPKTSTLRAAEFSRFDVKTKEGARGSEEINDRSIVAE